MKKTLLILSLSLFGYCSNAQNTYPSSGNVGIGTIGPAAPLQILGSAGVTAISGTGSQNFYIKSGQNLSGGTESTLQSITSSGAYGGPLAFGTGNTEIMRITSSGNVGIGTTSPRSPLDINGAISITNETGLPSSGVGVELSYQTSTNNGRIISYDRTNSLYKTFNINDNVYVQGSSGNVGIGTTNPTQKFHIAGGMRIEDPYAAIIADNGTGAHLFSFTRQNTVNNADLSISAYNGIGFTGNQTTSAATSAYQMYLTNAGNVGIGTISPIGKFDIRGNAFIGTTDLAIGSTGSFVQIDQGSSTGNTYTQIRAFSNGGNTVNNLMLQNSGGSVGIGTTDPQGYKLAVNGSVIAESVTVKLHGNWPDYVFTPQYKLPSLKDVKIYIDTNQHLPDMPSEQEIAKNGINLEEIVKLQTKKLEELTLYLIEKERQMIDQEKKYQVQTQAQQQQIDELKQQLSNITKILAK